MTKRDLILRISNDIGIIQTDVLAVVQLMLDGLSEALTRGENIELRNFGVFEVKLRKGRMGRNPKAPIRNIPIPPRAVVKFKVGRELKASVLKLSPALEKQMA